MGKKVSPSVLQKTDGNFILIYTNTYNTLHYIPLVAEQ